jgi:hypothetical protein
MIVAWLLSNNTPSKLLKKGLRGSTSMAGKLLQPENALSPMVVTLLGMVTLVKEPENV